MTTSCRHCNGTGADWWLVSDDYTGIFGNREQHYSASACDACAGTGSTDPAAIAAARARHWRTGPEIAAAYDALMAEYRAERLAIGAAAATRIAFVNRAGRWACVPRVGAMPWRVVPT